MSPEEQQKTLYENLDALAENLSEHHQELFYQTIKTIYTSIYTSHVAEVNTTRTLKRWLDQRRIK
jgi:hypothetical protein